MRLLPLRALSGPASPCLLREFVLKESHTPVAWTSVLLKSLACTCVSPHQIPVGPDVPLDIETQFPVDVVERPWNWPVGAVGWEAPTATVSACHATGQERLQCNGPGIEVQLSVSKRRNSKTHVRKVQHHVFVQSGCSDT